MLSKNQAQEILVINSFFCFFNLFFIWKIYFSYSWTAKGVCSVSILLLELLELVLKFLFFYFLENIHAHMMVPVMLKLIVDASKIKLIAT